uniref:Putative vignain-like n=1 Tax=Davidia involucrata TaxID=16924 RepID=A0A5B7AEK2_DAVIN
MRLLKTILARSLSYNSWLCNEDVPFHRPERVNWKEKGVLSPVRNQGPTNDCFAISSAGAIESLYAIVRKEKLLLSVQELLDCDDRNASTQELLDSDDRNARSRGGYEDICFEYVMRHGLSLEEDYPYNGDIWQCRKFKKYGRRIISIDGFAYLPPGDIDLLLKAVAVHPVIAYMETGPSFRQYKEGIFEGIEDSRPGDYPELHSVNITGYDRTPDGREYLIIKNSYGTNWGINGYMHLLMRSRRPLGAAGIYSGPLYPILNDYITSVTMELDTMGMVVWKD